MISKSLSQRVGELHGTLAISRSVEVLREEFLDYMTFKRNDRPLFTEIFGPLIGLKEEWAAAGATPEEIDMSAFRYRRPGSVWTPVNTGWSGSIDDAILEETEEEILGRDHMGRTVRLCKKSATLPLPIDHPVKNIEDWKKIKSHYEYSEDRVPTGWEEEVRAKQKEGLVVSVSIPGGFDEPRQLLGEEEACVACYEQPELIHDILNTIGDTAEKVLDQVSKKVQVDVLFVHEDMAGKSGPLWGPKQVTEFIKPYYRRIWDMLADRGARLFGQDSDGDMNPVLDAFLDAGLNMMHPMEPAAGMDIVKVREKYRTRLAIEGGIDKFVLQKDHAAIEAELEYKIPPMVRTGGCVIGFDHRLPAGSLLDNYRFYIKKAWEIIDRETAKLK